MTPKLQQLLDSLSARNVQKILLIEGQNAQVLKNGAWSASSLQVTGALLDALELEEGAREMQTASGRYLARAESGETRRITLSFLGATNAQLKIAPPPMPRASGGDKFVGTGGDLKVAESAGVRNVGARVGELKGVPMPAPQVAAPVAPQQQQWFYAADGEQVGPKSRATMQSLITGGTIMRETLVWREGLSDWVSAGESELKASFAAVAPPVAANIPVQQNLELDFSKEKNQIATQKAPIILVLIVLFITVILMGAVRDGNSSFDRSVEFGRLVSAKEAEADDVKLKRVDNSHYEGQFLYSRGNRGDANVTIRGWDWLGRPADWKIETQPVDFSSDLERQVKARTIYEVDVSLSQIDGVTYEGQKQYYMTRRYIRDGQEVNETYQGKQNPIRVTITSFDSEGYPDDFYVGE